MRDDFAAWAGRSEDRADTLEPARANALEIALGRPGTLRQGDVLPPLRHWLYFWDVRPPSAMGRDGHPAKGDFLPPVPLPRRMWAGGRLSFHRPLLVGETVTKRSTILNVETKAGRSGKLLFVTVKHELEGEQGLAIIEEQDLVYRELAAAPIPMPAAQSATPNSRWHRAFTPDPVLLFRFSALTMNGHRIHYDRPYATSEEGYPALVVHGPLQATLLADLASDALNVPLSRFDFRGQAPAFDSALLHVCGEPSADTLTLWTEQGGTKSMTATATAGRDAAD